jgi:hypothetical protein
MNGNHFTPTKGQATARWTFFAAEHTAEKHALTSIVKMGHGTLYSAD